MSEEMMKIYTELSRNLERRCSEYLDELRRLNGMWSDYRNAVNRVKRIWDADNVTLNSRLNQLKAGIDALREELEALKVKKELGLIEEEEYSKLSAELSETLTRLTNMYEEAKARLEEIDRGVKEHWLRSMDVATVTPEHVEEMSRELEEARERGEVTQEVYERIRSDLEIIRKIVGALSSVRN